MGCTKKSGTFVPANEEEKRRYEMALRHVEYAKAEGKSSEELHKIFKDVMAGDASACPITGGRPVPTDPEAKARYESAVRHAEKAKAEGKSMEEVKAIFDKVINGTGVCPAKK